MDEVRIVNLKQVGLYIKNGLQPRRIEFTDRLVFIFLKEDAKPLFDKWCNHTLV